MGVWFCQIIPTGCQLLNLFDVLKKKCIELNKDDPAYDYDHHDDSLDGCIRWSPRGVHFAPIDVYNRLRFEVGEFISSPTPALQSGVGLVTLNDFTHTTGLEIGNFFDDSSLHINVKMREYTGDPSHLNPQKIPPDLVGNKIGKVVWIRRVSGSKESPNGLVPVARSSPRNLVSVPPHFLDNTQAKSFGKLFLQMLPLSTQHTLLLGTNFASILQVKSPVLIMPLGFRSKAVSIFPAFRSC